MPLKGQTVATRERREAFLERLRNLGDGPECVTWPWTTKVDTYPVIKDPGDGRVTTVHRWVYEQVVGPLDGLEACHRCDNPPCVRPSHLFAATHGENMRDAYRKGRKKANSKPRPGVLHHNARLTEAEVYAIRRLARQGVSHSTIARSFGMQRPTISRIVSRSLWPHLPEATD